MTNHIPQVCDICGAPTLLVSDIELYGRPVGDWEWHILCSDKDCRAHVPTKPGTAVAKRRMDTPATLAARIMAHRVFDKLWSNSFQRRMAYAWLAKEMGLHIKKCHIALFSYEQCHEVVRLIKLHNPVIPEHRENSRFFERTHHE